jgi:acyl carrier protein
VWRWSSDKLLHDSVKTEILKMTNGELHGKLTGIFRDVFDDDELVLAPELTADDVDGWDSLSHLRLMLTVEKTFKVKFTASELGNLKNVGELTALLGAKLQRQSAAQS